MKNIKQYVLALLLVCSVSVCVYAKWYDGGWYPDNRNIKGDLSVSGDANIGGQIVYQTDKYIVCDVFTSTGINACIDLLGSEGGEVYLPEGTYTGGGMPVVIDYASTTITGAGVGTILDWSTVSEGAAPVAVIDTNDKDYVTIRNLKIIGGAGNGEVTNLIGDGDVADFLTVQNCWLINSDNYGIRTNGINSSILNNYISGSDSNGINLGSGADYITIRGNNSTGNTAFLDTNASFGNIVGNISIADENNGIKLDTSAQHNIVSNNTVSGQLTFSDIFVKDDFNIISNNNLYGEGSTNQGIYLDEADECVVSGNYTDNHDVAGIQEDSDCQDNLIYGNNCQDSTPRILNGTSPESFITNGPFQLVFVDTGTTPSKTGDVGRTAQYVVYIATAADDTASWIKVSDQ